MSYRYNQYRDTFEHIQDEQPITANYSFPQFQMVRYVELSQECIEQIADAVVRKLKCPNCGALMKENADVPTTD